MAESVYPTVAFIPTRPLVKVALGARRVVPAPEASVGSRFSKQTLGPGTRQRARCAESGRSSRLPAGRQFGQGVDDRASGWRVDIRPLTSRLHQRAERHLSDGISAMSDQRETSGMGGRRP